MGSATSTLTPEQAAKVTEKLKPKFSFLMKEDGNEKLFADGAKEKLTQEYNKLVEEISANERSQNFKKNKDANSRPQSAISSNGKSSHNLNRPKSSRVVSPPNSFRRENNSNNSKELSLPRNGPPSAAANRAPGKPVFQRAVSYSRLPSSSNLKRSVSKHHVDDVEATMNLASPRSTLASPRSICSEGDAHTDCWETVHHQPYCPTCCMIFKNDAALQRHLKYSDAHLPATKEGKGTHSMLGSASTPVLASPAALPAMTYPTPQQQPILGIDYKLLYTGSKFFWRTKETIDIHIYHHVLPDVLEIIGYDLNAHTELNRIYLRYSLFMTMLEHHPNHVYQFEKFAREEKETHQRLERNLLLTCLLQRLHLSPVGVGVSPGGVAADEVENAQEPSKLCTAVTGMTKVSGGLNNNDEEPKSPRVGNQMIFSFLAGDTSAKHHYDVLFPACPVELIVPVVVKNRKGRTSLDEIEQTIGQLTSDHVALTAATAHAERIQKFMHLAIVGLQSMDKKKRLAHFSLPRRRWLWAMHRVLHQNAVIKTRDYLNQLYTKNVK